MLRNSALRRGRAYRYRYIPTAIRTKVQSNQQVAEYNSKGSNVFGGIRAAAKDLFSGRGQFSTLQAPITEGTDLSLKNASSGKATQVSRGHHRVTRPLQNAASGNPAPAGNPAGPGNPGPVSTQTSGQASYETEYVIPDRPDVGHVPPAKDALTQPSASDLSRSSLATLSRLEGTRNPDPNRIMNTNPIYHNSFPNINDTYMSPTAPLKLDSINSLVKKSLHKVHPMTQYMAPVAQVAYLTSIAVAGKALDFLVEPMSQLWSNAYGKGYVRTIIPEAEPSGGPREFLRMREVADAESKLSSRDRQLLEHEPEDYVSEAWQQVKKVSHQLSESQGRRRFSTLAQGRSQTDVPGGSGAIPPFSRNVGFAEAEAGQKLRSSVEGSQETRQDGSIPNVPGQIYSKPEGSSDPASRQLSGIEYTQETIRAPESGASKEWKPGMPYVRSPNAQGESFIQTQTMGSVGTGSLGLPNLERDMHQPASISGSSRAPTSTGSSALGGTIIGRSNTHLAWIGYTPRLDALGRPLQKEPIHYTILEHMPRHTIQRKDLYAQRDATPHGNPFLPRDAVDAPLSVRFSHVDGHLPSSRGSIHHIARTFPEVPEFDAVSNVRTDVLTKAGTKAHHPRHFEGKVRSRLQGIPTSTHMAHLAKKYDFTDKHTTWSVGGLSLEDIVAPDNMAKAGTKDYKLSNEAPHVHLPPHARTREAIYDSRGDLRFGARTSAEAAGVQTAGDAQEELEGVSLRPPEYGLKEDLTKTEGFYMDLEEVTYLGPQSIREIEVLAEKEKKLPDEYALHPAHSGNIPRKYHEMEQGSVRGHGASMEPTSVRRGKGPKSPKKGSSTSHSSRRYFSTATPVLFVGKSKQGAPQMKTHMPRSDAFFTEYQFRVLAADIPDLEEHETQVYADEGTQHSQRGKTHKKKGRRAQTDANMAAVDVDAEEPVSAASAMQPKTQKSKSKKRTAQSPKHSEFAIHTEDDKDRVERMGNEYGKGYGYGNGQGMFDNTRIQYAEYGAFSYNALEPENMHQYTLMEKEKKTKNNPKTKRATQSQPSRYSKEAEVLKGISDSNLRSVTGKKMATKAKRAQQPSQEELHAEYTESHDPDWVGDADRESVRRFSPSASAFDLDLDPNASQRDVYTAPDVAASLGHTQTHQGVPRRHFHASALAFGSEKGGFVDRMKDRMHSRPIEEIAAEKHEDADTSLPRYMQSKIGHKVGFYDGTHAHPEHGHEEGHGKEASGGKDKLEQGLVFNPETKTWWRQRPDGGEEFGYYGEMRSDPSNPNIVYQAVAGRGAYGPNYLNLSREEIVMEEYSSQEQQPKRMRDRTKDAEWSKESTRETPWYDSGFVSDRIPHAHSASGDRGTEAKENDPPRKEAYDREPLSAKATFFTQEESFMTASRIDYYPSQEGEELSAGERVSSKKKDQTSRVEHSTKGKGLSSKPEHVTGSRQYHTSAIAFSANDPMQTTSRKPKLSPLPLEYIATEDFSGGYGAPWQPGRGPLNLAEYDEVASSGSSSARQTQSKPLTPQYHIFEDDVPDVGKPRSAKDESREQREQRKKRVVSILNPLLQIPRSIIYGVPTQREDPKASAEYVSAEKVEYLGEIGGGDSRRMRRKSRFGKPKNRGTSFRDILRGSTSDDGSEERKAGGKPSHHTARASESQEIHIGEMTRRPVSTSASRVSRQPHLGVEEELQSHFHAVEMWHDRPTKESTRRMDPVAEHKSFDGFNYDTKVGSSAAFDSPEENLIQTPTIPMANEDGFLIDDSDREPRNARMVHREDVRPPSWMPQTPRADSSYSLPRSTLSREPTKTVQYDKRFFSTLSDERPRTLHAPGLFRFFQSNFMAAQKRANGMRGSGSDARANFSIFLAGHEQTGAKDGTAGHTENRNISAEAKDYLRQFEKDSTVNPSYLLDKILVRERTFAPSRMENYAVESGPAGSYTHYNEDDDYEHVKSLRDGNFVKVYPPLNPSLAAHGWSTSLPISDEPPHSALGVPQSINSATREDSHRYPRVFYPLESFSSSELRSALFKSRR